MHGNKLSAFCDIPTPEPAYPMRVHSEGSGAEDDGVHDWTAIRGMCASTALAGVAP